MSKMKTRRGIVCFVVFLVTEFSSCADGAMYPATVQRLHLTTGGCKLQGPVEQGSQVHLDCSVASGNPPVTARLLNTHGDLLALNSAHGNGLIRLAHTYHNVSCEDAGTVRCEAPGASENRTATLLVRCPPDFHDENKVFLVDEDPLGVTFGIRTHTADIQNCSLTSPSGQELDCLPWANVTGSPPDLTVTVTLRLDSLSPEEEGTWHLKLTNDAGSAVNTFNLIMPERDTALSLDHLVTIITVAVGVFLVPVICLTFYLLGKGARSASRPAARQVVLEIADRFSQDSDRSSHLYHEIPDYIADKIPQHGLEKPVARSHRHCRAPQQQPPSDYLSPTPLLFAATTSHSAVASHQVPKGRQPHLKMSQQHPLYQNTLFIQASSRL